MFLVNFAPCLKGAFQLGVNPFIPAWGNLADNQVKNVSSILFDLRIIEQAAEGAGEHASFGVLDPSKANPSDAGIGKMISLKN